MAALAECCVEFSGKSDGFATYKAQNIEFLVICAQGVCPRGQAHHPSVAEEAAGPHVVLLPAGDVRALAATQEYWLC